MNIEFKAIKTEEQAAAAAEIADIIWREHYAGIISAEQIDYMLKNQSREAILTQIKGTYSYYLIKCGDIPLGYAALDRGEKLDKLMFISKIYVLREYRASGIGRAVIDFFAEIAAAEGFDGLFLHVNKHNPSVEAYKKLGFSVKYPMTTQIGGGYIMDDYCMELLFPA